MRVIALAAFCFAMSGCALVGPKTVNGSFACTAPTGTCAPTLTIDDRAIKKMREQAKVGNAVVVPGSVSVLEGGQGRPAKIVFPAYFDAMGRLHEQTVVHTKFNDGLSVDSSSSPLPAPSLASSKIDLVTYASGSRSAVSYTLPAEPMAAIQSQLGSGPVSETTSSEVFPVPGDE